jgi:hypothetical protein
LQGNVDGGRLADQDFQVGARAGGERGEVRGGRFVSGFGGEQFALPDVMDSLRAVKDARSQFAVSIAGADPMNLVGILCPSAKLSRRGIMNCLYALPMQSGRNLLIK